MTPSDSPLDPTGHTLTVDENRLVKQDGVPLFRVVMDLEAGIVVVETKDRSPMRSRYRGSKMPRVSADAFVAFLLDLIARVEST